MQAADVALSTATLDGHVSVVVITDGDPNCEWDAAASRQLISDWGSAGIRSHIVGLPGLSGTGTAVLDELALAAGTTVSFPADTASLEQRFVEIVNEHMQTAPGSCVLAIAEPVEVTDPLHLVISRAGIQYEVPHDLGEGAGWTLRQDAAAFELTGDLCLAAQRGDFEALSLELGCVDLPVLTAL